MRIHRSAKKLTALVLAGAALAAGTVSGVLALGADAGVGRASATTSDRGNANAVPPILAPARPSVLAEIRRAEEQERAEFYYRAPANAPYSAAEFNGSATDGK